MKRPLFAALLLVSSLTACDGEPPPPRDPMGTSEPASTTSLPVEPPATASASADLDAGADAAASLDALVGSWEGAYDAKKGRVDMPAGVKDDARAGDDGKTASGPGLVKLTVSPTGDVSGKSEGSLGTAIVRGKLDGKMLRASFVPEDPLASRAMTGVLIGLIKGETIQAELRVAGPDALVVRQAVFELKKK